MEHPWCPSPSLVSIGRLVKDNFIPLCCMERGVGEDLAPRQGGLGPFRGVTEAVGGAPHVEALR